MRIRTTIFLLACCCVLGWVSVSDPEPAWAQEAATDVLELARESCSLRNFTFAEGKVYLQCKIQVWNRSGRETAFRIFADSPEDKEYGLLKRSSLTDQDTEEGGQILAIGADGHHPHRYSITFVGEHGGSTQKRTRLLPETIYLVEAEAWEREPEIDNPHRRD